MKIPLANVYAIIDEHRGHVLTQRKGCEKGLPLYKSFSTQLRLLNKLKKEFANLSDADQIPLGL